MTAMAAVLPPSGDKHLVAGDEAERIAYTRRQAAVALATLLARDLARAHHQHSAKEETELKG